MRASPTTKIFKLVKEVDPVPHGLVIDNRGKAFLDCPVRFDIEKCSVRKLLYLMGSGAFIDGEPPEPGEYTVRLVRARTRARPDQEMQFDSWLDVQLKSSNKEH